MRYNCSGVLVNCDNTKITNNGFFYDKKKQELKKLSELSKITGQNQEIEILMFDLKTWIFFLFSLETCESHVS